LPKLASNHNPLYLCFLSSWDYRHEPLHPAQMTVLMTFIVHLFFADS
jgi:hypothetical protein